ncbi:MAG: lytic transglycosylase domain-containing protein [Candidatus Sericytochromatia bacterium]|nr:lytic transglycosylase domain-containing protein [Candidatus Sericytochromatia bacterium]
MSRVRSHQASASPYAAFIRQQAAKHGVPTRLAMRVIRAESGGRVRARSHKGAQGLMQLMPATARAMGVRNPYDPLQNLAGGIRYLGQMLRMFGGREDLAVAAYNAGPGAVKKHRGIPPYRETRNYVQRVLGSA